MIFKQIEEVLDGRKTQTRRIVKSNEYITIDGQEVWIAKSHPIVDRLKWRVGQTHAVVPKRGAKGVARIQIDAIRLERLTEISEADAIAEGIWEDDDGYWGTSVMSTRWQTSAASAYYMLWEQINGAGSWNKDPLVWVITFHVVVQDGTTT